MNFSKSLIKSINNIYIFKHVYYVNMFDNLTNDTYYMKSTNDSWFVYYMAILSVDIDLISKGSCLNGLYPRVSKNKTFLKVICNWP